MIATFRIRRRPSTWVVAVSVLGILLVTMGGPGTVAASLGCGTYVLCNSTGCLTAEEGKKECEDHASPHCSIDSSECRSPDEDDEEQFWCWVCKYNDLTPK